MSLSFSFIQQWQEVGAAKCGVALFRGTGSVFSGRVGCLKRWRHLYSEMIHFIGAKASKLTPQVHSQFLAHSKVLAKHSNRPTDDFSRGASAAEIIFALDEEVACVRCWRVLLSESPTARPTSYFWHPPHALWLSRSLGRISPATNLHELVWPGFFVARRGGPLCSLTEQRREIWFNLDRPPAIFYNISILGLVSLWWGNYLLFHVTSKANMIIFAPRLVKPRSWMK